MEFVAKKCNRGRKKKGHLKKRRHSRAKFEVKTFKRRKFISERTNSFVGKEKLLVSTMQANSFWENYTAAQEWQKRHSITWWRTRCYALEYENQILRDKLRSLTYENSEQCFSNVPNNQQYENQDEEEEEEGIESTEENENLEFHVNEDMMTFLEQSLRHKIELKKKRESESYNKELEDNNTCIQGGAAWMHARNKNAKLLYGESSSTILAMETALQTTVDKHKDKAKPQYWPIIPLKP